MAARVCVFVNVCKVEVFASCCATLSPQTVSTDCTGRGKGAEGEEAGGWSLENGPGPRPALPWPSNCARILMTCECSM